MFVRSILRAFVLACLCGTLVPASSAQEAVDREYLLEATILGYDGIGGDIDGVRNPVLQAEEGEVVRITIVNGETLVHDIMMEQLGVKSDEVLDVGDRANITFTAVADDIYFCTIPGHRAAGMEGRFEIVGDETTAETGIALPINTDFESGTLEDWTAEGDAFAGQPVTADAVDDDGEQQPATGYAGQYWIDTGALAGSAPTGRLTSAPFEVTHPYASFLVGGGAFEGTHVELARADDGTIFYTISGYDGAALRPVVVDVSEYMGEEIFIRIVDEETGARSNPFHDPHEWAHIRFDQFRFYDERPSFPNELTREETEPLPPLQLPEHAGLSPEEAAEAMDLPEGFSVTVAASEPDVVRPIAFTYDDRGRLWVAEGRTYPVRAPDGEGQDRILIFEDTDGDGTLDSRKVFIEGLNLVSGLEVGFDGAWVGAAPYLLYIPLDASGDRPAGEPEVLLDGWGYHDTHETLNSFRWGPDGWLYGTQGVFTHSDVGAPGTPDSLRTPMNAGVWRFHPTRHEFEVYAHGTSNPWGLDWNEYGQPFITACVIPHLYHVVQGGRYFRQAGEHFNPYTYDDITTIADHVHWVGDKGWAAGSRRGGGGGHAHAGAMIYLGGSWPDEYRSRILMNNIHGYRANADVLERSGSGYGATHGDDFLLANDAWSQMLAFRYGPGGSVHAIDWYDKNQCHSPNPDVHEKSLGRIFKISHDNDRVVQVELQQESSADLVGMLTHENEWYVRHARRILQERGPDPAVHAALRDLLESDPTVAHKLSALWTLQATEGMSDEDLSKLLAHESEYVRAWAVQLLLEDRKVSDDVLAELAAMAAEDESALVRLHLASVLQRVAPQRRWAVLEGLHGRAEDTDDHNLPVMVWYATEPAVPHDMIRALHLAMASEMPDALSFTVRRIAAVGSQQALQTLSGRLSAAETPEQRRTILEGINQLVNRD